MRLHTRTAFKHRAGVPTCCGVFCPQAHSPKSGGQKPTSSSLNSSQGAHRGLADGGELVVVKGGGGQVEPGSGQGGLSTRLLVHLGVGVAQAGAGHHACHAGRLGRHANLGGGGRAGSSQGSHGVACAVGCAWWQGRGSHPGAREETGVRPAQAPCRKASMGVTPSRRPDRARQSRW
jgi:hypothetical protein